MSDAIKFYSTKDAFGEFSNFAAFPFTIEGREWRTTEHYFQAQKFAGTEFEEQIRLIPSPMIAARAGRDRKKPFRKDWDAVRDDVMRTAVRAKFTQHPKLAELLLSTGDAEIIEHTKNDAYWADGGDGTGKNMLGIILMEIREELRKQKT